MHRSSSSASFSAFLVSRLVLSLYPLYGLASSLLLDFQQFRMLHLQSRLTPSLLTSGRARSTSWQSRTYGLRFNIWFDRISRVSLGKSSVNCSSNCWHVNQKVHCRHAFLWTSSGQRAAVLHHFAEYDKINVIFMYHTHTYRSRQSFGGAKDILPKFARKTYMRQTFSLQISVPVDTLYNPLPSCHCIWE